MKNNTHKAYWALAIISFFWGTTWFVSKLIIAHIAPLFMSATRQCCAGFILILYFYFFKKYRPSLKELVLHFFVGTFVITFANGLTTWAIIYIPSGLGALLGCLFPFFLILLNAILYGAKINLKSTLGLLVGFTGVAIIFYSYLDDLFNADFRFGIFICLLGIFSWTIGSLFSSRSVLRGNSMSGIGYQMFFGGLQLFLFSYLVREKGGFTLLQPLDYFYFVYLVAVGSILCFLSYMYVLKHLPADISGVYAYINPIVALLLGVLILHEPIRLNLVIGTLVCLFGVYLVKKYSTTDKKSELAQ